MHKEKSADLAGWRDAQATRLEADFRAARAEHRQHHAEAFETWRRRNLNLPSGKENDMTVNTLNDLFIETLKDLYYVEKKLVKTLPKMAQKASSDELKEAIESHLGETETHVRRLEQVFELLDQKASGKTCEAIEGLIREAEEVMGEIADEQTLDAAIISSAQTVEHYEIARYGTLACWAAEIGNSEVAELLEQTLEEEKAADEKLSEIAEDAVSQRAAA
ncbi:ferritin-like domain-containing protein [Aestuariivirga litoralis]